jgi:hypothetical protein
MLTTLYYSYLLYYINNTFFLQDMSLEKGEVNAFSDAAFLFFGFSFQVGDFFGKGTEALASLGADDFQDTPSSVVLEDSENIAL